MFKFLNSNQWKYYLAIGVTLTSSLFSVILAQSVDPTKPLSVNGNVTAMITDKGARLVLETIIHGDQIHTAVINGKVLKVGDHIGGHQLVAVNDHSVVLRSTEERLKLTLFSDVFVK